MPDLPGVLVAMDITTILSTELRLLEPICTFSDADGYRIFKSEKFPNYYGGNGLQIIEPRSGGLAAWEGEFRRYFDPARYQHTTFTFADQPALHPLIDEAAAAKYHIERDAFMFVDHTRDCRPLPEGLHIRRVENDEDWARVALYEEESYADGDWYDPTATGPDRLLEKTRYVSEVVGIEWFYLTRPGDERIMSKLGIFQHAGIARLQQVDTGKAFLRQGLATALVSFAIDYAINGLGTAGLALAADRDYYAIDLYRRLGFVEAGFGATLMKYPIKNPAFMKG